MNRTIKFKMEIEVVKHIDDNYPKGFKCIMINEIFNELNGLAYFGLGKSWKINWKRESIGLTDKFDKEIFDGDIFEDGTWVVYSDGGFGTTFDSNNEGVMQLSAKRCKYKAVTSNIMET
jgi:hypothetical protein